MPSKTATQSRRRAAAKTAGAKQSPIEIVVRRGAIRRFDALKTRTTELPVVLTWDRRTDDRRDGASASVKRERRQSDRRKAPPFTWDLADFVVVERGGRKKKTAKKPSKK